MRRKKQKAGIGSLKKMYKNLSKKSEGKKSNGNGPRG